jgi:hypothetical protein
MLNEGLNRKVYKSADAFEDVNKVVLQTRTSTSAPYGETTIPLLYQDRKEKENPADFDMFNPDT